MSSLAPLSSYATKSIWFPEITDQSDTGVAVWRGYLVPGKKNQAAWAKKGRINCWNWKFQKLAVLPGDLVSAIRLICFYSPRLFELRFWRVWCQCLHAEEISEPSWSSPLPVLTAKLLWSTRGGRLGSLCLCSPNYSCRMCQGLGKTVGFHIFLAFCSGWLELPHFWEPASFVRAALPNLCT